jgi:Skp family chaperone for outer membrane proteins
MKMSHQRAGLIVLLLAVGCAAEALAQTPSKIGVFDSKTVFEQSAEGQRLQKTLQQKRDEFRGGLSAKEEEIRQLQQKLREGEFSLSEEKRSEMQKDMQRRMLELDSLKQEASNNMRIELEDVQETLDRKLIEVVQEIGAEGSYALILEKNTQVVFASPSMDISREVIERFNRKYPPTAN